MTPKMQAAVANHNTARQKLIDAFPGLEEDREALADTLQGISNLDDMLVAVLDSAEEDRAMIFLNKERIENLKDRSTRLEQRAEAKENAVMMALIASGEKKIEHSSMTIWYQNVAPGLNIIDAAKVPEKFWVTPEPKPVEKRIDKKALLDAIKSGTEVDGACLNNGGNSLRIKRK